MLADAIQGLRGCVLALGLSVFVFLSLRYRPRFIGGVRNGGVRGLLIITPTPLAPASRLITRYKTRATLVPHCAVNRAATNSSQDPPVLGCCQQPTNSPASGASRRAGAKLAL